jgi:hypothetical protein
MISGDNSLDAAATSLKKASAAAQVLILAKQD